MTTRIDLSIQDTKEYEKFVKLFSDKEAKELLSQSKEELERLVVDANLYERKVRAEKEETPAFKAAKEKLADLNAGEREVVNPVKAKRNLAVLALQSLKDSPVEAKDA